MPYPFPVFVNKGTFASGTASINVGAPASVSNQDLMIVIVESANEAIAVANADWTQMTGSPVFIGTANAAGGVRLGVFYKWAQNSSPGIVTITDTGNHTTGQQYAIRGVANTNFIHATQTAARTASTNVNCPGVTTTVPYCLIMHFIGNDKDLADTDTITSWFPPSALSNTVEIHDQTVSTALGGGIGAYRGNMQSPGVTGNTFGTGDTSVARVYLTIALAPGDPPGPIKRNNKRRTTVLK